MMSYDIVPLSSRVSFFLTLLLRCVSFLRDDSCVAFISFVIGSRALSSWHCYVRFVTLVSFVDASCISFRYAHGFASDLFVVRGRCCLLFVNAGTVAADVLYSCSAFASLIGPSADTPFRTLPAVVALRWSPFRLFSPWTF